MVKKKPISWSKVGASYGPEKRKIAFRFYERLNRHGEDENLPWTSFLSELGLAYQMVWPVVEEKNMAVVRLYTDPVQFAVRWEERPQKTDCYASYCPPLVDLGWDKEYEGFWVWQVPKPEHVSDVRLALEESGYVYKLRDMINAS